MTDRERTRRRFIWLTGTATMAGLAGCTGGGGGEATTQTTTSGSDGGGGGGDTGGVPEEYATATSIGGVERNPEQLSPKEAVSYQEEPKDGQHCALCRYYIEDKDGNGMGACAIVEGEISPQGYCVSFVQNEG